MWPEVREEPADKFFMVPLDRVEEKQEEKGFYFPCSNLWNTERHWNCLPNCQGLCEYWLMVSWFVVVIYSFFLSLSPSLGPDGLSYFGVFFQFFHSAPL